MTKLLQCTASGLLAGLLLQGAISAGRADWAALQGIQATQDKRITEIAILLSASVTPIVTKLADPDRLVLDFPATILAAPNNHISINRNGITAIRIGVQPSNPPTTRVVVDLVHAQPYSVLPSAHKVVLRLGPNEGSPTGPTAEQDALLKQADNSPAPDHQPEVAATTQPSTLLSVASLKTPAAVLNADDASEGLPVTPPASTATKAAAQVSGDGSHSADANDVNSVVTSRQRDDNDPAPSQAKAAGAPDGGSAEAQVGNGVFAPQLSPGAASETATPGISSLLNTTDTTPQADSSAQSSSRATSRSAATGENESDTSSKPHVDPGPGEQQVEQLSLDKSSEFGNHAVSTVLSTVSLATPPPDLPNATQMADPGKQKPSPDDYVIGEQDELTITVWKEKELSGIVAVRPDGKITLPLLNEIKVVGLTPLQLQDLLTEKFKPFLNVPQVTVAVRQINSRNVYLIGQVGREGMFPIKSSTTVLQLIAEAGGLRDFAKRKGIYILRKQQGKQVRLPFNYDEVIRGKNSQQNVVLQPGDTIVVP